MKGEKFPNKNAAEAAAAQVQDDWIPDPYQNVGGGRHVPHDDLPPQVLTEPVEMDDGSWFVPDVETATLENDTDQKRAKRRKDNPGNRRIDPREPDRPEPEPDPEETPNVTQLKRAKKS